MCMYLSVSVFVCVYYIHKFVFNMIWISLFLSYLICQKKNTSIYNV